jgi:hypothetical protein
MSITHPLCKTLIASGALTTSTATAFVMPEGCDTYCLIVYVSTVSGTSPTADFVLQTSPDGGTTYINMPMRSTQVTAAGQIWFVFKQGLGGNEVALESPAASTGGTLAKNVVFDPTKMKLAYTLGGTSPSFTTTLFGLFTMKSTQHR